MTAIQTNIPMLDLQPEIDELWDELQAAFSRVLRSGRFVLGPEVEAFESEVAEYLGTAHAIGVNSGTDALIIALRSLGIGPGDEVITTPFTFVATAEAICNVGATPVFVDIDPDTFNIDPALIEPAITERTRAIVPVHLFGLACEMDRICDIAQRHNLRIIEDTAQAFGGSYSGRKLGTIGDLGTFSFFPSKNLGAYGDGGLITTDDPLIAESARKLRSHGGKDKYKAEMLGYNSRLDELQAAILRVKLPHIDRWNQARIGLAQAYHDALDGLPKLIALPRHDPHVYHQYTIRISAEERDYVQQRFQQSGVGTAVYYPKPLHRLPSFANGSSLPRAESATRCVLSLPMSPNSPQQAVERITQAFQAERV